MKSCTIRLFSSIMREDCFMSWLAKIFLSKEKREEIQKELEEAGGYDAWVEKNERELKEDIAELDKKHDEYAEHSRKIGRAAKDYSRACDILEHQIRNNLFTETEILEITKEKNHATEVAKRATKATDDYTKLMWKQTKLAGSFRDRSKELQALEKEDREAREKVFAYDEEVLACYAVIEKWIALGRQREANGGLTNSH